MPPPIDFVGLAAALLDRAHELVPRWLPAGVERAGRWYIGDFDGNDGESANVNLRTGQWIDNGAPDEDVGGDLISLYARIHGLSNGEAARELMQQLGWERPASAKRASQASAPPAEPPPDDSTPADPAEVPAQRGKAGRWRSVLPVPPHAPVPQRFRMSFKDRKADEWVELEAVRTWEYVF
jgi:putative DNA primase/helicase